MCKFTRYMLDIIFSSLPSAHKLQKLFVTNFLHILPNGITQWWCNGLFAVIRMLSTWESQLWGGVPLPSSSQCENLQSASITHPSTQYLKWSSIWHPDGDSSNPSHVKYRGVIKGGTYFGETSDGSDFQSPDALGTFFMSILWHSTNGMPQFGEFL